MGISDFPYDEWVSDAMHVVLQRALQKFSNGDYLGDHHLYISFNTYGENVSVPDFLKAQYPDEITIVLQHQFKDLYLDEHGFEVTLSFSGQNHRLCVPFDMVTSFADPSVNFGIQIKPKKMTDFDPDNYTELDKDRNIRNDPKKDMAKDEGGSVATHDGNNELNQSSQDREMEKKDDGAEVINIEAFRKR